jgi:hypothetical protein
MERPKQKYIRNEAYLKSVRGRPCLICMKQAEAHHVNHAEEHGISMKVGDNWVVPLCHSCHMNLHLYGDEKTWWDMRGVDPIAWAKFGWETFIGRYK